MRSIVPGAVARPGSAELLRGKGCVTHRGSAGWQAGELSLGGGLLALTRAGRPCFELPLARLTGLAVEQRKFVLVHKEVIRLTYAVPGGKGSRQAWLITAGLGRWLEALQAATAAGEQPQAGADPTPEPGPRGAAPPQLEFHDEGDTLLAVAIVPGAREGSVTARVDGARLLLRAERDEGLLELAAPLPCRVRPLPRSQAFSNGVLSLWLAKE